MNYTLDELRQLSTQFESNGIPKKVVLHKRLFNAKTGKEIWRETNPIPAKVAFRNMSLPFDRRPGGWKNIVLSRNEFQPAFIPEIKLDQNSLSNPALIEQLKELGFERKEPSGTIGNQLEPVLETSKTNPSMTPEEMLDYLKSQGLVHGKVKLKTESEPENEIDPSLNLPQNETEPTA